MRGHPGADEWGHMGTNRLIDGNLSGMLAACAERAVSRREFEGLALPAGMSRVQAWCLVGGIRLAQGVSLPSSPAEANWYARTRLLEGRADECLRLAAVDARVSEALVSPEGRHLKIGMLLTESTTCLEAAIGNATPDRLSRATLGLHGSHSPQERLAANLFPVLLESVSGALSFSGPDDVADLVARCLHDVDVPSGFSSVEDSLSVSESILASVGKLDPLMRAVTGCLAFGYLRPFPLVSPFLGRMYYASVLHAAGLSVLSYLPFLTFMRDWRVGSFSREGYRPSRSYSESVWHVGDTCEWTARLEEVMGYLSDEAAWFVRKLGRMHMRRERLEALFACDARYNERQHDVLVEAMVHDDAEFAFDDLVTLYDVAYSTAHGDLVRLADDGYLCAVKQGKRLFFIAGEGLCTAMHAYLRKVNGGMYERFFDTEGRLRVTPGDDVSLGGEGDVRTNLPRVLPERRASLLRKPRTSRA